MSLNTAANLEQQVAILLADNKALKAELAKYKPEILVELSNETGFIEASITHHNEIINVILDAEDLKNPVDTQSLVIAEELAGIFIELVYQQVRPKVAAINANLAKTKQVNKW